VRVSRRAPQVTDPMVYGADALGWAEDPVAGDVGCCDSLELEQPVMSMIAMMIAVTAVFFLDIGFLLSCEQVTHTGIQQSGQVLQLRHCHSGGVVVRDEVRDILVVQADLDTEVGDSLVVLVEPLRAFHVESTGVHRAASLRTETAVARSTGSPLIS